MSGHYVVISNHQSLYYVTSVEVEVIEQVNVQLMVNYN